MPQSLCFCPQSRRQRGLTLLELLIVLMIAGVIVLIAIPTLRPSDDEARVEFAKTQLRYLYNQQNTYFTRHGRYAQFSEIAGDPELGPLFDSRFVEDSPIVEGVKFTGPRPGSPVLELTATLPDGSAFIIDGRGEIRQFQQGAESGLNPLFGPQ
jgi:prepilin-type N-terminal cleavage/methylation domain-containing protein